MKEHIDLSIPTPCHEKWSTFTPTGNGGYCASCKKEVIDFTKWSDERIKAFFTSRDHACGRFRKEQLKPYPPNPNPSTRYQFIPASLFALALLLNPGRADASDKKGTGPETVEDVFEFKRSIRQDTLIRKVVTGIIRDEADQSAMPGVNVVLKGTTIAVVSDSDGKFTIEIPKAGPSDILEFSFIGYKTVQRKLSEVDLSAILMPQDELVLGEMVIMGGICARRWTPRGLWWRIRNIFARR